MFDRAEPAEFTTPLALAVLRRVDAATCADVGSIDRHQHIEQIARVVLRAKGIRP